MDMKTVTIAKKEFTAFIAALIKRNATEIIGPVARNGRFSFEVLGAASELRLDFDETTQSPRKFLFPARDTLLTYSTRDAASYKTVNDDTRRVIIGVHPGDLTAIALYDKAYAEGEPDAQYCARRANAAIVGLYPVTPYQYRFTGSMIKDSDPYLAADLMMIDMGNDTYAVEIVSKKGEELIGGSSAEPADTGTVKALASRKKAVKDDLVLPVKHEDLPKLLAGKERHETFKTRGDKCFSCGSCVNVCPTCVCFDVRDRVDLSLKNGIRYRTWDGCTLENFATVAGGHNFRKNAADRLRHRLFRKAVYLQERLGITGCVGCGRCTSACTAGIASIVDMVTDITGKGE
ncbi:MAG: 4Fe-4S dicluster domain-containing protein [Chitinispirillaceae bacterium]|nr:4Fe-4S dicluster domain-containing protein [Chitinispirillaceae bacterium]